MRLAKIKTEVIRPLRLHLDSAEAVAANWLSFQGWIAGRPRGRMISAAAGWGKCGCVLLERPDVCKALTETPEYAYGFQVHILSPDPPPGGRLEATLSMDSEDIVRFHVVVPKDVGKMPLVPFATEHALNLTRELFCPPADTGEGGGGAFICPADGPIMPKDMQYSFENTRIGNYHPDIMESLCRPGAIGLDIGCGIRDTVFDNLVTQDIYPTPTATVVTRPEILRLPFADGVFDLIIMDSVLEHVPDPVAMLKEAKRLLRPGGLIFGDVPFLQPLHLAPHHYFNFTPFGLRSAATQAGLELQYAEAEKHQRPEYSLEWMLRRTFENISPAEAAKLRAMRVGDFYNVIAGDKNCIGYSSEGLLELSAGYRFRIMKHNPVGKRPA